MTNITLDTDLVKTFNQPQATQNEIELGILKKIISALPGYVYWVNRHGYFLGCNQNMAKFFGLQSPKQIVNKTIYDFYSITNTHIADKISAQEQKIMSSGAAETNKDEYIDSVGHQIQLVSCKTPILSQDSKVVGLLVTSHEFSLPDNDSSQAIKKHRDYFPIEKIMSQIPVGIYWKDKQGVYRGCNQKLLQDSGIFSEKDIVGKTIFDVIDKKNDLKAMRIHEQDLHLMETKTMQIGEKMCSELFGKDTPCIIVKSPLLNSAAQSVGLVTIVMDKLADPNTTPSKKEPSQHTFKHLNILASSLARDLTILYTGITCSLHAAERLVSELLSQLSASKFSELNAEYSLFMRSLKYINTIFPNVYQRLAMSKSQMDMQLSNVNYKTLNKMYFIYSSIQNLVNISLKNYPFKGTEKALIHVDCNIDFTIKGAPELMQKIIFNLLKNALEAISLNKNGGKILISTQHHKNYNCVIFQDTALGIHPKHMPFIFDKFFSCNKANADVHLGLGLTFAKFAMQSMGGQIICESELRKYTRFILKFPIVKRL